MTSHYVNVNLPHWLENVWASCVIITNPFCQYTAADFLMPFRNHRAAAIPPVLYVKIGFLAQAGSRYSGSFPAGVQLSAGARGRASVGISFNSEHQKSRECPENPSPERFCFPRDD